MIEAKELPAVREALIEYGERVWPSVYLKALTAGKQAVRPQGMTHRQAATWLASNEVQRLRSADLYYVSDEMTDVADSAGRDLPGHSLTPQDFPSNCGLIVFARPISVMETAGVSGFSREGSAHLVAASWSPAPGADKPSLWVTLYSDTDLLVDSVIARGEMREMDRHRVIADVSRLTLDNETVLPLGDGVEINPDAYGAAIRTFLAAVLMMQQPELVEAESRPMRKAARRALKDRSDSATTVRLIRLRRRVSEQAKATEGASRDYRHRWIVRGHWRNQWYPSRQVHRPKWIPPYLKGPDGAPLLTTEKVNVWDR